jgi:hypothetical protein
MSSILSVQSEAEISLSQLNVRRVQVRSAYQLELKKLEDEYKAQRADLQRKMLQTLEAMDAEYLKRKEQLENE